MAKGKTLHYIYIFDKTTREQRMFDILINKPMNGAIYAKTYPCPPGYRYLGSSNKDIIWKDLGHIN